MLQISGGGMRYGARTLFDGLDWLIQPGDRLGVVGANGTGKSTLLKIIAGLEQLDHGEVTRQKGLKIGYLPQDGLSFTGRTVFEECLSVFDEAIALEQEQEELAHKMGELDPAADEYTEVLDRYSWVTDRLDAADAYTKEAQTGTVLGGLAFPKEDWDRPTDQFSGGWQMRIALAKLLLEKPDILLLDEPTNHLDLEARNWLEDYLKSYPRAFLVISHDRYFLDVTIKEILEIWNQEVHFYKGNYSKYETQKTQRRELLMAAYKNQQTRIEQLEAFINRFRYQATKAKQVQSRIKELEKIERIVIPPEEKAIHFKFPQPPASGRMVAELRDVSKSYGPKEVFAGVTLRIDKGDRIALVGANGAGKSTLIRVLSGDTPLTSGERTLGHKVDADYFAQDQYKEMDPEAVLFDELGRMAPRMSDTELRSLLGCFLFSGDDAFKKIGVLSGGERNRFALARMLLQPSNFLLMDEPTNHLDMRAKDVLLEALLNFTGTLVFVSHDRYFIDRLATKVFAVGDGQVESFPGNYEDYLWAVERRGEGPDPPADQGPSDELLAALESAKAEQEKAKPSPSNGESPAPKKKRLNPQVAEKIRRKVAEIETEIGRLESESEKLQSRLAQKFDDYEEQAEVLAGIEDRRKRIEEFEQQWEKLTLELEG